LPCRCSSNSIAATNSSIFSPGSRSQFTVVMNQEKTTSHRQRRSRSRTAPVALAALGGPAGRHRTAGLASVGGSLRIHDRSASAVVSSAGAATRRRRATPHVGSPVARHVPSCARGVPRALGGRGAVVDDQPSGCGNALMLYARWLGRANPDRAKPPIPLGGGCRSDWSDMGCSHTERCPLFPLLNASLRSWRDYYCDTKDGWRGCARYKLSLTGVLVPITLLPNGASAQHLRAAAGLDGSGTSQSTHAPSSGLDSGLTEFTVPTAGFEQMRTPAQPLKPSPSAQVPQTSESPPARLPQPERRPWWTRLADWISGPS
jgi:hypothetical protein